MKGLKRASEAGRTPLYYSYRTDTVYTAPGDGRYYVTDLIRKNTPDEIKEAVMSWKRI